MEAQGTRQTGSRDPQGQTVRTPASGARRQPASHDDSTAEMEPARKWQRPNVPRCCSCTKWQRCSATPGKGKALCECRQARRRCTCCRPQICRNRGPALPSERGGQRVFTRHASASGSTIRLTGTAAAPAAASVPSSAPTSDEEELAGSTDEDEAEAPSGAPAPPAPSPTPTASPPTGAHSVACPPPAAATQSAVTPAAGALCQPVGTQPG